LKFDTTIIYQKVIDSFHMFYTNTSKMTGSGLFTMAISWESFLESDISLGIDENLRLPEAGNRSLFLDWIQSSWTQPKSHFNNYLESGTGQKLDNLSWHWKSTKTSTDAGYQTCSRLHTTFSHRQPLGKTSPNRHSSTTKSYRSSTAKLLESSFQQCAPSFSQKKSFK
jgi:hypothetical protein